MHHHKPPLKKAAEGFGKKRRFFFGENFSQALGGDGGRMIQQVAGNLLCRTEDMDPRKESEGVSVSGLVPFPRTASARFCRKEALEAGCGGETSQIQGLGSSDLPAVEDFVMAVSQFVLQDGH